MKGKMNICSNSARKVRRGGSYDPIREEVEAREADEAWKKQQRFDAEAKKQARLDKLSGISLEDAKWKILQELDPEGWQGTIQRELERGAHVSAALKAQRKALGRPPKGDLTTARVEKALRDAKFQETRSEPPTYRTELVNPNAFEEAYAEIAAELAYKRDVNKLMNELKAQTPAINITKGRAEKELTKHGHGTNPNAYADAKNYIEKEKQLVPQLVKMVKDSGNYITAPTALNRLKQHGFPDPASLDKTYKAVMEEIAAMGDEAQSGGSNKLNYQYIKNPLSNKYVSIYGKTGQKVLKNYIKNYK